jgi:hypothetical protein
MAWSTNPITGSKSVPAQLSTTSVREQRGGSEVGRGFGLDRHPKVQLQQSEECQKFRSGSNLQEFTTETCLK